MMKSSYARLFLLLALQVGLISGCGKLEAVKELATVPEPVVVEHGTTKSCSGEGNLYFCLCGRNPLDGG